MARRFLFLVNGLGLGNATRTSALIELLLAHGDQVSVGASGNAHWYFERHPERERFQKLFRLEQPSLGSPLRALAAFLANRRTVAGAVAELRPEVVVTDSVYVGPLRGKARVPVVAINNAEYVVRKFPGSFAWGSLAHYLFVEFPDFLYHLCVPSHVLSPRFRVPEAGSRTRRLGKFIPVGPLTGAEAPDERWVESRAGNRPKALLILLSGSGLQAPEELEIPLELERIYLAGPAAPRLKTSCKQIIHCGKADARELWPRVDLAIVNAGYSSIAEGIRAQVPMVILPLARHAEQKVNAAVVERLGHGIAAEPGTVAEALRRLARDYPAFRHRLRQAGSQESGNRAAFSFLQAMAREGATR